MMTRKRRSSALPNWSLLFIALLALGCPGNGDEFTSPTPVSGLHYYLPQHVLEVKATSTETVDLKFDFKASEVTKEPKAQIEGNAIPKLTPDRSQAYALDLAPTKTKDGSLTVHVKENGLLESLNTTTTGRTGDIIGSVVRFATTLFTGLGGLGEGIRNADEVVRCNLSDPNDKVCSMGLSLCEPAADLPDDLQQFYFQGDGTVRVGRILLEDADKLFLSRHADGCSLWQKMLTLDRDTQTAQQTLKRHEQVLAKASASQVDALLRKIETSKAQLTRLQAERTEMSARFAAGKRAYLKSERLVFPEKKRTFDERLTLGELPQTSTVQGKTREIAVAELKTANLEQAARLLEKTGFLLSIDTLNSAAALGGSSTASACSGEVKTGNMRIHYRAPELRRLTTWKTNKEGKLVVDSVRHELLVDPQSIKRCFEFEASAFAERKLEITFGDLGQPTRLVRSHTASAAAFTSALASAAEVARDSYVTTLEKLATAEEKKRAIELADLQTDIDRITKEKELLEAEINLEGTAASRNLVLQQKQLAAQLATLKAELEWHTTAKGFDQAAEIASLKLELDRLKQLLEILRTQMQIDDLKD